MTLNMIGGIRRVAAGEEFTAQDPSGGGYYRGRALEAGYVLTLADGAVFLSDRVLEIADGNVPHTVAVYPPDSEDRYDHEATVRKWGVGFEVIAGARR